MVGGTIRRPPSDDSLPRSSLRPSSALVPPSQHAVPDPRVSPRSSHNDLRLATRSSTGNLRSPVARKTHEEPTLLRQLMRVELEEEEALAADAAGAGAGAGEDTERVGVLLKPGDMEGRWSRGSERGRPVEARRFWHDFPPEGAVLHPPLYGRPGPSPSPDIFATLLHPLLSLSRPTSPAPTPPLTAPSSPPTRSNTGTRVDRSSSSLPAHFPPRTPSDPGPTVESQGFVLYLSSLVAWIAFLVWGLCPDEWLDWLGIEWYPSREWALLVPAWTIMLAAFIYFSYIALNIFITPSLDSVHTLTDTQAYLLPLPSYLSPNKPIPPHPLLANSILLPPDAVPALHDLPIGLINRVVFGDFRRRAPRGGVK